MGVIPGSRRSPGEDPLEKSMGTHSSIPAWRTPWTEDLTGYSPRNKQSRTRLSDSAQAGHGGGGGADVKALCQCPSIHVTFSTWQNCGEIAQWSPGVRTGGKVSLFADKMREFLSADGCGTSSLNPHM